MLSRSPFVSRAIFSLYELQTPWVTWCQRSTWSEPQRQGPSGQQKSKQGELRLRGGCALVSAGHSYGTGGIEKEEEAEEGTDFKDYERRVKQREEQVRISCRRRYQGREWTENTDKVSGCLCVCVWECVCVCVSGFLTCLFSWHSNAKQFWSEYTPTLEISGQISLRVRFGWSSRQWPRALILVRAAVPGWHSPAPLTHTSSATIGRLIPLGTFLLGPAHVASIDIGAERERLWTHSGLLFTLIKVWEGSKVRGQWVNRDRDIRERRNICVGRMRLKTSGGSVCFEK